MKPIRPFILFALLCGNSSADRTEDNGRKPHGDRHPAEMVLSADFRVSELRQMPAPAMHPGLRLEKRDYPNQSAIEWQVRLQAPASGDSPLHEDVKSADFYPLTDWSDDSAKWLAFQFHDPAKGEGIVQAFCGANASPRSHTLKMQGLDLDEQYTITDWDNSAAPMKRSGSELSNAGMEVRAHDVNKALVLYYTSEP